MLTRGAMLDDFLKNPVMLYDHARRYGENDGDIILPIGKINNLRTEADALIGEPEFDMDDEFAAKVSNKFNKGYLNAASIGADIIELSTDPDMMLPGQTGPTITKWILKEISITDIPANADAVKLNYQGKSICLNGKNAPAEVQNFFNLNKPENSMKKVIAALNGSKLVTLTEASSEELVAEAVTTLSVQLSAKDQTIAAKDAEIKRLTDEAKAAKTVALTDKATTLVEGAMAANKIVATQKENFVKLAAASEEGFEAVKGMLDSMKGFESPSEKIKSTEQGGNVQLTLKQEFVKLADEGGLETLRASNPEHFKKVYKAGTGKEFKD
jgi:hypothetical protein